MATSGRVSFGGMVVEDSLSALGFRVSDDRVALVETASPRLRYDAVLLQSAWNVLSPPLFREYMRPYPSAMKRRARLRRLVARTNLRRAGRVVCLTETVANMLADSLGIRAEVAPVTVPLHDWLEPAPCDAQEEQSDRFALVPGTVTWYKQPELALSWLSDNDEPSTLDRVVFLGRDDGSGSWLEVRRQGERRGIAVEQFTVPHSQVYDLYRRARVTVLPSRLESLGFGLSEALLHSPRVWASPIPPHREVAGRTGREPTWIGEAPIGRARRQGLITRAVAESEWVSVGEALGLASAE